MTTVDLLNHACVYWFGWSAWDYLVYSSRGMPTPFYKLPLGIAFSLAMAYLIK